MKEEIAKKWCEALRSGKYKQCTGRLRRPISESGELGHCCLGVLCELSGMPFDPTDIILPDEVKLWAGMRTKFGSLPAHEQLALININDDGEPFTVIADLIEKHWQKL